MVACGILREPAERLWGGADVGEADEGRRQVWQTSPVNGGSLSASTGLRAHRNRRTLVATRATRSRWATLIASGAVLVGCGVQQSDSVATSPDGRVTSTTAPSSTSAHTETPSATEAVITADSAGRCPDGTWKLESTGTCVFGQAPGDVTVPNVRLRIDCTDEQGEGAFFSDPAAAWSGTYSSCDGEVVGSDITTAEAKALARAYGDDGLGDTGALGTLWGLCAQSGGASYRDYGGTTSPEQAAELRGMLTLCPEHPDATAIAQLSETGERQAQLEASGRSFNDGIYLVGDEVKPGTYVTKDVEGCYWERQDSSGDTIDNGYYGAAKRVVVTIRSSDYAFSTEDCGQWEPAR